MGCRREAATIAATVGRTPDSITVIPTAQNLLTASGRGRARDRHPSGTHLRRSDYAELAKIVQSAYDDLCRGREVPHTASSERPAGEGGF